MCGLLFKTVVCSQNSHMFDACRHRYALILYYYGRYYSLQIVLTSIMYELFRSLSLLWSYTNTVWCDRWMDIVHAFSTGRSVYLCRPWQAEQLRRCWSDTSVNGWLKLKGLLVESHYSQYVFVLAIPVEGGTTCDNGLQQVGICHPYGLKFWKRDPLKRKESRHVLLLIPTVNR